MPSAGSFRKCVYSQYKATATILINHLSKHTITRNSTGNLYAVSFFIIILCPDFLKIIFGILYRNIFNSVYMIVLTR